MSESDEGSGSEIDGQENSFVCPVCSKQFKTKKTLKQHVDGVHGTKIECQMPLCMSKFSHKTYYYDHLYNLHRQELSLSDEDWQAAAPTRKVLIQRAVDEAIAAHKAKVAQKAKKVVTSSQRETRKRNFSTEPTEKSTPKSENIRNDGVSSQKVSKKRPVFVSSDSDDAVDISQPKKKKIIVERQSKESNQESAKVIVPTRSHHVPQFNFNEDDEDQKLIKENLRDYYVAMANSFCEPDRGVIVVQKLYKCQVCQKAFLGPKSLADHMTTEHSDIPTTSKQFQ